MNESTIDWSIRIIDSIVSFFSMIKRTNQFRWWNFEKPKLWLFVLKIKSEPDDSNKLFIIIIVFFVFVWKLILIRSVFIQFDKKSENLQVSDGAKQNKQENFFFLFIQDFQQTQQQLLGNKKIDYNFSNKKFIVIILFFLNR